MQGLQFQDPTEGLRKVMQGLQFQDPTESLRKAMQALQFQDPTEALRKAVDAVTMVATAAKTMSPQEMAVNADGAGALEATPIPLKSVQK